MPTPRSHLLPQRESLVYIGASAVWLAHGTSLRSLCCGALQLENFCSGGHKNADSGVVTPAGFVRRLAPCSPAVGLLLPQEVSVAMVRIHYAPDTTNSSLRVVVLFWTRIFSPSSHHCCPCMCGAVVRRCGDRVWCDSGEMHLRECLDFYDRPIGKSESQLLCCVRKI